METKKYTDLSYLKKIARGNQEFTLKVINTYIAQTKSDINKIEQYLSVKNWDSIYFIAHKMKPSFQLLGIKALQEIILNIETFAKEKINLERLPSLITQLVLIYEASKNELKEEIQIFNVSI